MFVYVRFILIFSIVFAFLGLNCLSGLLKEGTDTRTSTPYSNLDFSTRLFRLVNVSDRNLAFSPQGIGSALYFLAVGSDGETKKEILTALGFNRVNLKNQSDYSLYYKPELLDDINSFSGIVLSKGSEPRDGYKSKFKNKPRFQIIKPSLDVINSWASKHSLGLLPTVMDMLSPSSSIVLLNISSYDLKFNMEENKLEFLERPFKIKDKQEAKSRYLQVDAGLSVVSADEFEAVRIYPVSGDYRVYALLPKLEIGIDALVDKLDSKFLSHLFQELDLSPQKRYRLEFPEFSIKNKTSLNVPLQGVGVITPFSTQEADFNLLSEQTLQLSDVYFASSFSFKADLGSFTGDRVGSHVKESLLEPLVFRFDRPFLLIVTSSDNSHVIFFAKISNPVAK